MTSKTDRRRDLERVAKILNDAQTPEEVFGGNGIAETEERTIAVRQSYHRLAKATHEDLHGDSDKLAAREAFRRLTNLYHEAEARISAGIYGTDASLPKAVEPVLIKTKKETYLVGEALGAGDLATVYDCKIPTQPEHIPMVLKVARDTRDNDLIENEARVLKVIHSNPIHIFHHIPVWIDSVGIAEAKGGKARRANVLQTADGLISLRELREAFPEGLDARHVAWIWKRLLTAMATAHSRGVVHGAVLPDNIMIRPENHGAVLVDWCYSVVEPAKTGERIRAISAQYSSWYPPEVAAKGSPTPSLDILMGSRCMIYALGGDPVTGTMPQQTPRGIAMFLRSCLFLNIRFRPGNAWKLHDSFDELLREIYGAPKFVPLVLPLKA